jgi:HEAT repeat protein
MLAGKSAVITVVAHGADDEAASFDLALNRQNLPGMARVERLRADMNMPGNAMGVGNNPAYYMGTGAVDESDIPALMEKLKSPDAPARAAAAEDLQKLGKKAKPAAEALTGLLKDASPRVQFEAAAALLQIHPKETSPLEGIAKGLGSSDASIRASAAEAAGAAGSPAGALAEKLGALLKDSDESVKINALLSITVLGPAASKAEPAVQALLENPEWQIDAADALGRMGAAAQPALPKLATMLSSEQYDVRWAAVRAMSQIGGEGAKPAVKFIIDVYQKGATEVEGYNSMVYLALLGPVASDALPTIQNTRIKNPALPSATSWAIQADKYLPWQAPAVGGFGGRGGRGGFGGPGGPGGPGGMMGGPGGIGGIIMQNYVKELGSRLAPTAKILATKILDGSAGEFPIYGYEILANNPDAALPILTPKLQDADLATRERAAVAIGYMGDAGLPAKNALETAAGKAANERENRLIQWALRQVEKE